ncbi:MAG: hypothetical protein LBB11_03525 [Puniceicoccales bacterium]|jgi:hypothetical protein|nr:hypothetical protein [Puniceicoccales bacterium]
MKKQRTLHERFIRMQAEALLKKMGAPLHLLDVEDEGVTSEKMKTLPSLDVWVPKAQSVIQEGEQFFAQFGLTPEKQEELFQMPIIQQSQSEIMAHVFREREELERTIGRPRQGWDPLPCERYAATDKILENLPQSIEHPKIEEIHLDEIFDRSAEEQIMAVQQRLTAALEEVKKAASEQKKSINLPRLPQRSISPIEVNTTAALPDLQEKCSIAIDFERRYAEQLKIVLPDASTQMEVAVHQFSEEKETETKLRSSEHHSEIKCDADVTENDDQKLPQHQQLQDQKTRSIEAISEDIEKMASMDQCQPLATTPAVEVVPEAEVVGEVPAILRKVSGIHPHRGVLIAALKSKAQHQSGENFSNIKENIALLQSSEERLMDNLVQDKASPRLPSSMEALQNVTAARDGENSEKAMIAHRRQWGSRRLYL